MKAKFNPDPSPYVWGYRRVSSVKQSYERQTKALLDAGVPEDRIFEDKLSGKFQRRPGLNELLDHRVRAGDTIYVSSLDRLGRTTIHILETMETMANKGVKIRSLKPGEEFEGITGKLILTIMAAVAEWERENINERAAEARAAREANGISGGRPKTVLVPDKVEAVRALRAAGKTINYIVQNQGMSRASIYRALDMIKENSA